MKFDNGFITFSLSSITYFMNSPCYSRAKEFENNLIKLEY
jgi:hypothetical protein